MNGSSQKSGNRDDSWLRERIAEAVGPSDASHLTDSELDALLNAYADASYSEDRVEHLLARFWTELAQKKSPGLADSSSSDPDFDDSDGTPAPPKSPVLGFLGGLMGSDGWPNTSRFSGYLIAALTATGLMLSIAVVLLVAGLLSKPGPKDVAQSPQNSPLPPGEGQGVRTANSTLPPVVPDRPGRAGTMYSWSRPGRGPIPPLLSLLLAPCSRFPRRPARPRQGLPLERPVVRPGSRPAAAAGQSL